MTNPGIGAAGVIGIAFEQLLPPVLAGTPAAGGALTAGTYKYYITALNALGETTISNEITVTTSAGNLTAALTWGAVAGATGYKIYRTAAAGGTGTELLLATVGAVLLYNDAAVGAPAGAFPLVNTAGTPGTYTAPTKYFPLEGESLKYMQDTQWRRPMRNTAGIVGAVAGDSHIEGDINIEALSDVVPYFLYCTRCTVAKSGTGPFTYVFTPSSVAIPAKTMSVTIVRNGVPFGYVGCVVGSFRITPENELLKFSATLLGRDEASQSVPVPTFPTTTPFGAGQYSLQIPTASQILDADGFEFTVDDSATPAYRLKSTGTGAAFIYFGESAVSLNLNRDFTSRTDYDAFKALTAQSVTLQATKGGSESITILVPSSIKDTYETDLTGEGELVRATITYQGVIDGTGKMYQVTVVTPTENII